MRRLVCHGTGRYEYAFVVAASRMATIAISAAVIAIRATNPQAKV